MDEETETETREEEGGSVMLTQTDAAAGGVVWSARSASSPELRAWAMTCPVASMECDGVASCQSTKRNAVAKAVNNENPF